MRRAAAFAAALAVAGSRPCAAGAHEFWMQPRTFHPAAGAATPVAFFVGHGADRARWRMRLSRVVAFRSVDAASAVQDRRDTLREGADAPDAALVFTSPGLHVVTFETNAALSTLPADKFEAYAREEGLTLPIEARRRAGVQDQPGREHYSRRAKALVQVGPALAADRVLAVAPAGLSLEIVPEADPYVPGPRRRLPVRVLSDGRPLPGATVKLTDLDADAAPAETHVTDAAGRAVFRSPRTGSWQFGVIWSRPAVNDPEADFETTFSSLTFGLPPK